jgi:hypothetical protein
MLRKVPPSCCEVARATPPTAPPGRRRARATAFVSALLLATTFGVASAQDARGILAPGNAVVTGFSGTQAPPPAPGNPDLTEIDLAGPSVRIVDLQNMGGPAQAQLVAAPKPFTATAAQVGQVFAVALDDAAAPNIYVGATSAYGLPIVAPGSGGGVVRARQGAPGASFMPGLFGPANLGGGPGSIWRIDGVTGQVRLFANVTLEGAPNPGPALGGLAFDKASRMLFVADRGTGMIHAFDLNGQERGRYDHGTQGRVAAGLPPVAYDPARRLDITSASFKTDEPATWGFAADERRVFGLATRESRLFYAVAGEQVWSVSIMPDGTIGNDARIDVQVPPWDGESEISKITFDDRGLMLLAERAVPTGAYDFAALAKEAVGRVLRYQPVAPGMVAQPSMTAPDQPQATPANQPGQPAQAASLWQPVPDEYPIGFPADLRNDNGGVAIGYSYTPAGALDRNTCGGLIWSTGERLRQSADQALAARLAAGGPAIVNGLQGNALDLVRPANVPPLATYFVDYNDKFDDVTARGHMGDIAILRVCGQGGIVPVVPLVEAGGVLIGGFCQLNQIRLPNGDCCERRYVRQGRCDCPPELVRQGRCCPPELMRQGRCCPPELMRDGRCCPPELMRDGRCCPPELMREGRCCPPGTIQLPNGQCCPRESIRDGRCTPCPEGSIQLPNGQCCPRQYVHNGQCCPPTTAAAPGCNPCPEGSIQLPNGQCCPRQYVHNGQCCPPTTAATPGCNPPQTCPPGQIQLPNGQCCPREWYRNGECHQPIPRSHIVPTCPRGTARTSDGTCGQRPIIRGRLHIDRPHHRPEKPVKPPKRERSVAPNWKPTGGQIRLNNNFRPSFGGGGGGMGTHRGR